MANGSPGRPPKYTEEFKRNALNYYLSSGKTQRECAEEMGVPRRTFGRWVAEAGDPERSAAAEARALRKEVERLRQENEFLKKAATFFAANRE